MRVELEVLAADPSVSARDVQAATRPLRRQLDRCEQLIAGLLALARSESGLVDLETVDLAELSRKSLVDIHERSTERHLQIEAELGHAPVDADRRLIELLLGNLLGNALVHNHDGGWLKIETGSNPARTWLVVSNSGAIVRPAELQDLMLPFRRGGSARVGAGHGLGLSLVDAVAKAHGACLDLEPPEHGGLRISVVFPPGSRVAEAPAASLPTRSPAALPSR